MNKVAASEVIFLCILLSSCIDRPNIRLLNQDLGIIIPKNYSLVRADSDPFGLGADADNTYVLRFDSVNFQRLEKAISISALFNIAGVVQFDSMALPEKLQILKKLALNKMIAFWIKSDDAYWFDSDSVFLNTHDNVIQYLFPKHIFLPNRDSTGYFDDGKGIPRYRIKAVADPKNRTLYYHYTHI